MNSYVQRQVDSWNTRFAGHLATYLSREGDPVTVIQWAAPGTWVYGLRILVHSQWLIFVGDCGESTYQWPGKLSLDFLKTLNFDYFASKCRASSDGQKPQILDPEEGKAELTYLLEQSSLARPMYRRALRQLLETLPCCASVEEWTHAVHRHYDAGDFDDPEEASCLAECAIRAHPSQIGHWVALNRALAQL